MWRVCLDQYKAMVNGLIVIDSRKGNEMMKCMCASEYYQDILFSCAIGYNQIKNNLDFYLPLWF